MFPPSYILATEKIQAPKGQEGPQVFNGYWPDSQTFGGIRPALRARLPARGLPPHPGFSRGFGHLLTVIASRNPAPSRDAAAGSLPGFKDCKTRLAGWGCSRVKGQPAGRSPTVGRDRARTGGEARTLDA